MRHVKEAMLTLLFALLIPSPSFAASFCSAVYANAGSDADEFGPWQRARVLCDLRTALKAKYSLQEIKEEKMNISLERQLDGCIRREIVSNLAPKKYEGDYPILEFEDRVLRCLSAFWDTHLKMSSQTAKPQVYAGFSLARIGDKFFISSVSKLIAEDWAKKQPAAAKLLQPGAEVVSVNGISPAKWVSDLSPYIAGSSKRFVAEEAAAAITLRNFAYPQVGTLEVGIAGRGKVRIPWWMVGINQRSATREFFKAAKISSAHNLSPGIELDMRDGADARGYDHRLPLEEESKLTNFFDDKGSLGLRLGNFEQGGRSYCYVQILTFATKRWRIGNPGGRTVTFAAPFEQMAVSCEANKSPLILDLRSNAGGDSGNPAKVLAAFAEAGKSYPSALMSGLLTSHFQDVLAKYSLGDGFEIEGEETPETLIYSAFKKAVEQEKDYLPFVASPNISTSLKEGAFGQKIVALVTPQCVSACDLMAGMLKISGRAHLVGTFTNGTGGRFLEIGESPAAGWKDDLYGTISVRIPNSLHALLPRLLRDKESGVFDFEGHKGWVMENRPITAHTWYDTGLSDILGAGAGWREKAIQALQ